MALASAPPVFAYHSNNYPAGPLSNPTTFGTAFTAGGNDADGAAVTLLSALGHDVHLLKLTMNGITTSTADGNAVADLLIDPAGGTSWTPLIDDLACGFANTALAGTLGVSAGGQYVFPLYIPAGASVGLRAKTAHTADITTGYAMIEVYGEPTRPEVWWCGQGVETLGVSDSKGTSVTPGTSNAWGSWTSVGSTTSRHLRSIQLGTNGTDSGAVSQGYYFEVGTGSVAIAAAPLARNITSGEAGYYITRQSLLHCNIPTGTQMQVRGMGGGASVEANYVGLYGVY